jgi:hypothetical protein
MTKEEYLELERAAAEKHEYIQGKIFPMSRAYEDIYSMAGASLKHVRLVNRLQVIISNKVNTIG